MTSKHLIEYAQASADVRAVYDDIKRVRQVENVNNCRKCLAAYPPTLRRTRESLKAVCSQGRWIHSPRS